MTFLYHNEPEKAKELYRKLTAMGLKSEHFFFCKDCEHRHTFPENIENRTEIERRMREGDGSFYIFTIADIILNLDNLKILYGEMVDRLEVKGVWSNVHHANEIAAYKLLNEMHQSGDISDTIAKQVGIK